jgi:hypothetical protein
VFGYSWVPPFEGVKKAAPTGARPGRRLEAAAVASCANAQLPPQRTSLLPNGTTCVPFVNHFRLTLLNRATTACPPRMSVPQTLQRTLTLHPLPSTDPYGLDTHFLHLFFRKVKRSIGFGYSPLSTMVGLAPGRTLGVALGYQKTSRVHDPCQLDSSDLSRQQTAL